MHFPSTSPFEKVKKTAKIERIYEGKASQMLSDEFLRAQDRELQAQREDKGEWLMANGESGISVVQPDKEILERPDIIARVSAKVGDIPHESQRYRFVAMNAIAEDIAS